MLISLNVWLLCPLVHGYQSILNYSFDTHFFYLDGRCMETVRQYSHLGHIVTSEVV